MEAKSLSPRAEWEFDDGTKLSVLIVALDPRSIRAEFALVTGEHREMIEACEPSRLTRACLLMELLQTAERTAEARDRITLARP